MTGRRRFVAECGRVAFGLPLLSLAGCSRQASTTPASKDAAGAEDAARVQGRRSWRCRRCRGVVDVHDESGATIDATAHDAFNQAVELFLSGR